MTTPVAASVVEGSVVFTDLVGFTEFTAAEGDEAALELLATQERIVLSELPGTARIVKELGDGLLLWFADACDAITTSLRLQDRFEAESRAAAVPIWVRMGSHWGRQTVRRNDLIGHDVNVAARIVDMAAPGEILVSDSVVHSARDRLDPDVAFEELGPVVMKGLPDPVRLYRVGREIAFGFD